MWGGAGGEVDVADGFGEADELGLDLVEEGLQVGAADAADGDEAGDLGAVEHVGDVVEEPLGAGGAGRAGELGQVQPQLVQAEGQRAWVLAVHDQQVEHSPGAYVAPVAAAVGDRGLGGGEDRVEHGPVDLEPLRTVVVARSR